MYAIIRSGSKQYTVREGDFIAIEHVTADEGSELTFNEVLLLEDRGEVSVGSPTVNGAEVTARVEEHFRARKVLSLKYKNKTRQRTLRGHRQYQTRVQITGITAGSEQL